ncbi:MAG: ATP-binding protein [Steroidobacteraceae bacterium]|jgi:two-component system, OmpR family, sensor histidine kinase QseC
MAIAAAAAACIVFLILGLLVYRAVASSTATQFDELLQQQGALALRYADHEYNEGESVVPRSLATSARAMPFDVVYQITTRANQLLYRSPGSPEGPLAIGYGPGYSNAMLDGRPWRVYSLSSSATPLVIHIAEPLEYRDAALSRTLHAVALPLVFALVLLTFLIGVVTERAFRPVRRMAADLAGRGADDLSAVNTAEMPVETHALGVALNGLLARHAEVLARERRFTADAAHELRTPLAALRAQAQVAARATTPSEARRALDKLQANIDRTAHLMSQLLSLARLEPGSSFSAGQTTQAKVVVDLVLDDLAQAAREKQVEITLEGCLRRLPGSPEVLYLLIRNLLENSIRHVSERGRVALKVIEHEQCAVLLISDNGPGIPSAERSRALERFYRIPGSGSSGSGLGLSIVGRVVELLTGEIELSAPATGTGLVVTVRLPFTLAQTQDQTAA